MIDISKVVFVLAIPYNASNYLETFQIRDYVVYATLAENVEHLRLNIDNAFAYIRDKLPKKQWMKWI